MHLSISSSNDRLPTGNWLAIWIGILVILLSVISFFEWHIRSLGWSPSVVDSVQLWSEHRKRASELGDKAIILVGASQMQLDMDLYVVAGQSGLEPVQLAIDGTSYMPVLESLAEDPTVTGTVLVSVNAYNMSRGRSTDTSLNWVNYYQYIRSHGIEPYRVIHNKVVAFLNDSLVLRLQGAIPYTIISKLAFQETSVINYLVMHPNRSRDADYKKVQMPMFYAKRLRRHYGAPLIKRPRSFKHFFDTYKSTINATQPVEISSFLTELEYLLHLVSKIESNGGKVIFVRFPTGKLVWEVDNKRYPKALFWNKIEKRHPESVNFSNYPALAKIVLPDGSHLDYRDKVEFTRELMEIFDRKGFL